MARKQYSYRADLFYSDPSGADGVRKESHRIIAYSDQDAIREARNACVLVPVRPTPAFFRVRKVFRTREEIIFDSKVADA
jgi:hypothetical protein